MKAKAVRTAFLEFFSSRGHQRVRSSDLVPHDDPTLLFANAGMNQFKDVFTGQEAREYSRATSAQKCVRAGGKHNDLENVGFTARHHTFFEMLGNFSFGDYFKPEAIEWAHTLLFKELGLDPKRMVYTVFGGDPGLEGVGSDDEARALWKKIAGVGDDRIYGLGAADNFWQMGDVGPMGPCTELHYYVGDGEPRLSKEAFLEGEDQWIEVWNLVFMQYERTEPGGPLKPLPAPSVDTGAGLERLAAVIDGKRSNYDTDLFMPLIERVAELAKKPYRGDDADDSSMRVIADHARATAFLVADGVFPDKTGREYVLRRIFRRAVRHGKRLGIEEPFMHQLCGEVIGLMGADYPELVERKSVIENIALEEETSFRRTLDRGLRLLEDEFDVMQKEDRDTVAGAKVFQLYDTYGFPKDLTAVIAGERGKTIDEAGFDAAMAQAQARSEFKVADKATGDLHRALAGEFGATEFSGYDGIGLAGHGKVLALVVNGERQGRAKTGDRVEIVCDRTPFYGASGGQIGDTGHLRTERVLVEVKDTAKPAGDMIVHIGQVKDGVLEVGEEAELEVDSLRRGAIRANHSATHLLHLALKRVLGDHAAQKGSLVAPDRLRFDFSHFSPMTEDEKHRVEDLVNHEVLKNVASKVEELPIEEAKQRGAVHMFGEKYGDSVRVVSIGSESLEFCGGTHVERTGDIGLFKILSEQGIAQGVRRIEAVTGTGALEYLRRLESELTGAADVLRTAPFELADRAKKLVADARDRDREIAQLKGRLAAGGSRDLMTEVTEVGGVKLLAARTEGADMKSLREVGDKLRDRLGSGVVVLAGVGDGKVSFLAMVTKDLTKRFHAGKIVGEVAGVTGGRGGGRPDMAQAGGKDASKVDAALSRAIELVTERAAAG